MGVKQGTTVPLEGDLYGTGTRSKGSSSKTALLALYPDSPVLNQEDTDTGATGFSLSEADGYASSLRSGYQTLVLDVAQASALADAPNLANVVTPSDQPDGDGEIVSPYMPNPATGQGAEGVAAVPTDRAGENGSITSPQAAVGDYRLTAAPSALGTAETTSGS